jgi:type IX secretion system PorP/SprF family membrane protein
MNRMKKATLLLFAAALIISVKSFGQQDAMYSQYMFNQLLINPAYAGNHEVISANLLFRDQWVGIDGAPVTETFSVDAPLHKNKVGVGLSVYNDKIGITKNTGAYFHYAFRIKFRKSMLALGLQAGISNLRATYDQVSYSQDNSMYDYAFSQSLSEIFPNFGAGLFYNTENFYFGFSVPYLLKKSLFQQSNIQGYRQAQHYFLSSGYVFKLNQNLVLKPSLLLKYVDGAPLELDLNANMWFYGLLGIGASYRTGDSFDALLELQLNNQLRLGYAYDYSLTDLQKYNYGSHELMLKYEFSFKKSRIITPRYF